MPRMNQPGQAPTAPPGEAIAISVVIPAFNEADNLPPLVGEIRAALASLPDIGAEIIVVDDASTDDTRERLAPLMAAAVPMRIVTHGRRAGQSAAVLTGARWARGAWIATLDGDGQNDPADLPRLITRALSAAAPVSLVGGIRTTRRDPWSKRLATRFANGVRQAILADGCPDTGCGLKVFRRDAFLALPAFSSMHRFLPALFRIRGEAVAFLPVSHRPRRHGISKYGIIGRGLQGVVDILGVLWLARRTRLPGATAELAAGTDSERKPQP